MNTLSHLICGLILWSLPHTAPIDKPGTIFLSKDEGISWTPLDTGLPDDISINAWINIPGGVMISTEDHGIYISQDGLHTWHAANLGLFANWQNANPEIKIKSLVTHGGAVFAGSYLHGIYTSQNKGSSWQKVSGGIGETRSRDVVCRKINRWVKSSKRLTACWWLLPETVVKNKEAVPNTRGRLQPT